MSVVSELLADEGYKNPEHANLQEVQPMANVPAANAVPPVQQQGGELPSTEPVVETPPVATTPETPAPATEGANPPAATTEVPPVQPATTPQPEAEIDDATILATLSKKLGRDISSFEDLAQKPELTDEQKAAAAEKLRNDAISYGLTENIISRKDIENYSVDAAKDPRAVALELVGAQLKAHNPAITQDEINDYFSSWAMENEPEDSILRQIKQKEIEALHANYITSKYGNLLGIESAYGQHQEVLQQAHKYKSAVDTAMVPFKNNGQPYETSFPVGEDKHQYNFKVKPEVIAEVEKELLDNNMFNALGKEGTDQTVLKEYINNRILLKELPRIINEIAESHKSRVLLAEGAGRRGVQPERDVVTGGLPAPGGSIVSELLKEVTN